MRDLSRARKESLIKQGESGSSCQNEFGGTLKGEKMKTKIISLALCTIVLFVGGCFSHKTVPGIAINPEIPRDAIEVLDTVEGTSTTNSILLGLIQVVDGDKLRLLGISFFREQYTYFGSYPGTNVFLPCPSTGDRAYYKALSETPGADAVFYKSMDREYSGIPLLWSSETVTFRGKAIKLKTDQELYGPGGAEAATRARSMWPYKLKTDPSGEPVKDKDGNFIFVPVD